MEAVAVIDFGSQYAHLIANRVRRLGVYAEIFVPETPLKKLQPYKGIILSGGPQSVYVKAAPTMNPRILSLGIPVLGLCYGHQLIAYLLGGTVESDETKEYGLARLSVKKKIGIFEGVHEHTQVWMSHGDSITRLPRNFVLLGSTPDCAIAAMGDPARRIFSVQFHMEVAHTKEGTRMFENFLKLCRVKKSWNMERFMKNKIEDIKRTLGERKVFMMVSGGVDSTVAYSLLTKALGEGRVFGLFVDTGLLRKDEGRHIEAALKKIGIKNFHALNAKKVFLSGLKGVIAPEEKRAIIGDLFLKVQADTVKKLRLNPAEWVLGQGTIYPDTIESAGTKYADKIKTHHNRVPEILELIKKGKVIEPLAELYKDEVRELGSKLGLPDSMVWKHPFPGPGLGVRILCAHKPRHGGAKNSSQTEEAIAQYLLPYGLSACILPIQSVGVQGDSRTYRNPLAVWGKQHSFEEFEHISTALTNRFPQINRVCLLLSPEKITSVRVVKAAITEKRIALLQFLDDIVMSFIKKNGIEHDLWQFPTVLVPLLINGKKTETVILRPICSDEAMTAHFYKMASPLLKKLTARISPKVSAVLYDMTNKPPGTIEWE